MKKILIGIFMLLVTCFPINVKANSQVDFSFTNGTNQERTGYDWWQYDLAASSDEQSQFRGPLKEGAFAIYGNFHDDYTHRIYIDFDDEYGKVDVEVECKNYYTGEYEYTTSFTVSGTGQVYRDFRVCSLEETPFYTDTFKIYIKNAENGTIHLQSVGLVTEDYDS